ncbi:MAG TPA: HAD family hydrolase, partial [Candidatus Dormibacteraeota bacterium]|nr:HAD family hydrolase [Candidatus Dormibacteraeota bacterium]
MDYKSVFLDIDGTILKPDHTFTDSTKNAIRQMRTKGIEVFLATGRPLHELRELANQLDVHSFIGYNGAYATHNDQTFYNEPIHQDIVKQYIEISEKHGHEIVFYTSEKNYFTSLDGPIINQFIDTFELQLNELYTNDISSKVLGITVMNLAPNEAAFYELEENIRLAQVNLAGLEHCFDVIRKD